MFNLNSSFTAQVANRSSACGYTDYSATYATYPPKGTLPLPKAVISGNPNNLTDECWVSDDIVEAASNTNPAFNPYKITDIWPLAWVRIKYVIPNSQ
jgi:carboxypeptidase D